MADVQKGDPILYDKFILTLEKPIILPVEFLLYFQVEYTFARCPGSFKKNNLHNLMRFAHLIDVFYRCFDGIKE